MRQRPSAVLFPASRTPGSYVDDSGVSLHIDVRAFVFHIDAAQHHKGSQLNAVLSQAAEWGLEPFDPEVDDDAEVLDDGTIRIWLTPTFPEWSWVADAARRADHALINHLEVLTS